MKWGLFGFAVLTGTALVGAPGTLDLCWPTPNRAFVEGRPIAAFLQQAGSGDPASGGFGGVRNAGRRFHEGIDIQPVAHDRRGEASDPVFAAFDGVVRYINPWPGNSSYGRYIVLEHPELTPAIYTLYAHLSKVASSLKVGGEVHCGQVLGVMGRSAGGYVIPRSRSHLHFEMGLRLTNRFQSWYDWKRFGSANPHGNFNGFNLMGFDPLGFMRAYRSGRAKGVLDYLRSLPVAVTLRYATLNRPDFIIRYPSLLSRHKPMLIGGWEVAFDWAGLPIRWTPLSPSELQGLKSGQSKIVQVNAALVGRERSKQLVRRHKGRWVEGHDLATVLQLLFGRRHRVTE